MERFTFLLRNGQRVFSRPEMTQVQGVRSLAEHLHDSNNYELVELIVPGLSNEYYFDSTRGCWTQKQERIIKDFANSVKELRKEAGHHAKYVADESLNKMLETASQILVGYEDGGKLPTEFISLEKVFVEKDTAWFPVYIVSFLSYQSGEGENDINVLCTGVEIYHESLSLLATSAFVERCLSKELSKEPLNKLYSESNIDWNQMVLQCKNV